ncbi:hypothetical protein BG000_003070, partial [Podila horticola]
MYYSDEEENYYDGDANSDDSHSDSGDGNNSADEEQRKLAVAAHEKQQQLKQAKLLEQDLEAIKDREDPQKSAAMWMDTLAAEGSFTFFENGQYYAFSVPWQLEQALNYGDVVIIDRMPNVFGGTDTAIPVSYLLTKSGKTTFLSSWMNAFAAHIKDKLDVVYAPKVAFSKRDDFHVNTVRSMFPESRLLYCNSQTDLDLASTKITRQVKKPPHEFHFFTPKQKEANRRMAEKVVKGFEKLMRQQDVATAMDCLNKFRSRYQHDNFLEYIEKHYFAEKESWMYAYRQGIPGARDAGSNLGATWQSSLRENFVKDFEQTREDRVIYSLARQTEVTFGGSIRANAPSAFDRRIEEATRMKAKDPSKSLVSVVNDNTLRSAGYSFQLRPAFTRPSAGSIPVPQALPVVAQSATTPALIEPVVQESILRAPAPESSQYIPKPIPAASQGIQPAPAPSAPVIAQSISPPAGFSQVAQKRGVDVQQQNSPIVVDGDLPPKAEPVRTAVEVSLTKIALIKNALGAIGKSVNDLSTGEEIRATLGLAIALWTEPPKSKE